MEEEQRHRHLFGGGETGNANTMPDLRHFFSPTPTSHFLSSLAGHHNNPFPVGAFTPLPHHNDLALLTSGRGGTHDFHSAGLEMDARGGGDGGGFGFGLGVDVGGGGGSVRWPRQETLTLLEIRSRLDHKFKEANHKGPLWDEVSRIMSEEHGYQRSGKKCREKFENLYKYYKKTKGGKVGRQDGRHYRFFRQLEAIYGESTHNHHIDANSDHNHLKIMDDNPTLQFHNGMNASRNDPQQGLNSISLSKSYSDLDTSSSEQERNGESSMDMATGSSRKRRGSRSWRAKIKDFIDSQMIKIMEKQEAWMEKMLRSLENKEQERMSREEERRKQDARRIEEEHKFWADERAWIEARDRALMDVVQRMTGREVADLVGAQHEERNRDLNEDQMVESGDGWEESEITKLIELRISMETKFEHCGGSEEGNLWEEISARMVYWGHGRSARVCKEKWDSINMGVAERNNINKDCNRKRKNWRVRSQQHLQSSQSSNFYSYGEMVSGQGRVGLGQPEIALGGGNPTNDSCLRVLLGDGGEAHVWKSYDVKLNKGETH